MVRELLSALTPDFTTILYNGSLDRAAIQDCAKFLQTAVGRNRDRNVNMWGILLYFLLILNMMFQNGKEDQREVFEWMVKSVTRTTFELNNHSSLLEQFVLAVNKMWTTHRNPLGREHETLFWHNYRTNTTPFAAVFQATPWYAFRVESVVAVIKNVLGKTFSCTELYRCVGDANWATTGKSEFYDIMTNAWPIATTVHDPDTGVNTLVPLAESELHMQQIKQSKCIFIKQGAFQGIIDSVERGSIVTQEYETIEISSANNDVGNYNFYEAVVGDAENGWYGYRALCQSNFGVYCGATNEIQIGSATTDLRFVDNVLAENAKCGFDPPEQLYQPASLLELFNYDFPVLAALPPAILMCPFEMRNADSDAYIHWMRPPWYKHHADSGVTYDMPMSPLGSPTPSLNRSNSIDDNTHVSPRRPVRRYEDDEQSNELGDPSPNRRNPGSNPLGEATLGHNNSPNGSPGDRPIKRRRAIVGVAGSPAAQSDGQEVRATPPTCPLTHHSRGQSPFWQDGEENTDLHPTLIVQSYEPGQCINVIDTDEEGNETVCGNPCNPSEQLCRDCRVYGHRMTGLF